jgi:hypothetical protein
MNSQAEKLARAIRWDAPGLSSTVAAAERACHTLLRHGESLEPFFTYAMGYSTYGTLLLIRRFLASGQLTPEEGSVYQERLTHQAGIALEELSHEEDAQEAVEKLSELTAAALVLEQPALAASLPGLLTALINTKETAVSFSRQAFELLRLMPEPLPYLTALYRLEKAHLSLELNEQIAYHQGVEIPLPQEKPEIFVSFIRQEMEQGHLRYVDSVLKVFLNAHLADFGYTPESLCALCFSINDDNFFRSLLFLEKMIMADTGNSAAALEQWWKLVSAYADENHPEWQKTGNWFQLYYLSRQVSLDPAHARAAIAASPVIKKSAFIPNKTNTVIQEAMTALFMADEPLVFEYLEKIGENNVLAFRTDEVYYPYFDNTFAVPPEEAFAHLLTLGYSDQQIVDIYMNSYLRSCLNFHRLLQALAASAAPDVMRNGVFMLRNLFDRYTIQMDVRKSGNAMYFIPHNMFLNGKSALMGSKWLDQCKANYKDGDKILCKLMNYTPAKFWLFVEPVRLERTLLG